MPVDQTQFRAALTDPERPAPNGLTGPGAEPAGRRFDVYRNNVAVSLREALQTGFPILEKLIGAQNFAMLAQLFARAHPPASPLLMHYGAEMPGFLESFAPLQHIAYLPDIARLELALRQSYHAADSDPAPQDMLAGLTEDSRITLAPSLRHLPSPWPIWDIWRFNTQDGAEKPRAIAQHVLILRAGFDPEPHALTPSEGAWIAALLRGEPLGAALEAAMAEDAAFDMTPALTLLLQSGAIASITS